MRPSGWPRARYKCFHYIVLLCKHAFSRAHALYRCSSALACMTYSINQFINSKRTKRSLTSHSSYNSGLDKYCPLHAVTGSVGLQGYLYEASSVVEVCMGMGKTGIPWVPWDSYGNGNKISHGMGMGWEWEWSAWEWELRRGSGKKRCIL